MTDVESWRKRPSLLLAWALVTVFVATSALTGCNTVRGIGQDVENAGDAVKDATN